VDQLKPIPLVTPGFKGLNTAQASVPDLDPGYATTFQNFIFDYSGRIAARQGWAQQTATPLAGTPAISVVFEWVTAAGVSYVISAANNHIYQGTATLTSITGSLTITANNWQFFSFNGAVYGVQAGHPLIKWTGSGNFTTITPTTGTVPTGGVAGMAAFGRLWIVGSDYQTVYYCDLLSDVNWNDTGSGSFSMGTVWTRGTDQIVAIAAAGAKIVVFGYRQIVIFYDSNNPPIGLNPQNLCVYDTIEGTGCTARDTVQSTGEGDLTWLAPTGIQNLQRLLSSGRDNPVAPLDPQVCDYVNAYFVNEVPAAVRAVYSPANRFYMLLFPVAMRAFVYDTRAMLQPTPIAPHGSLRCAEWPAVTFTAVCSQTNGNLLFGQAGVIGLYTGYTDNGAAYQINYVSPNLALAPNMENVKKVLKRMKAVLYYTGSINAVFSWGTDFAGLTNAYTVVLTGNLAEYGIAQYNINEYGGGAGLSVQIFPLSLSGRWMQFGMSSTINGSSLALQQLDAFAKVGVMD
jgi:hypothetical protein